MSDDNEAPEVNCGAVDGSMIASVVSKTKIGEQAALVLVERESGLTGWKFEENGTKNSNGQFVYILKRKDGEQPNSVIWDMLTKRAGL